jgi:MATE family multidrug resistance protein
MSDLRDPKPLLGIGEVLRLSWPAGLSMLNSTVMRFVDGLMVSWLGTVALNAQFVGGLSSFVPESFATGMLTVVNTFVAQNMGVKRLQRCGQYAWAGLTLALLMCLLVLPLIPLAPSLFGALNSGTAHELQSALVRADAAVLFADDTARAPAVAERARLAAELSEVRELEEMETMYFRYMVAAIFFTLTARPIEQFFYGIHRPGIVLASSIVANVVNVVLVYVLVFGHSGLVVLDDKLGLGLSGGPLGSLNIPKYGLEGAAWANLISWGLYLAILLGVFLSRKLSAVYATRRVLAVRLYECLDLIRVGWPAGVQFVSDVFPWTIMTWIISVRFGPTELAATTAAMRWMPLSFMPAVGIGIATTALVGKYMGQSQPHIARRRAHAAVLVSLLYMSVCAVLFLLLREPMIHLFVTVLPQHDAPALAAEQTREIIRVGGWVMICAAAFQLFDALGIVFIGALRGAGDTLRPMIYTITLSWGLVAGGGYLAATYVPALGSIGPWITGSLYVALLGLAVARRFESGRWAKIDLLHRSDSHGAS